MIEEMSLKEILAEPSDIDALHIQQNIVIDLIFRILFNEGNVSLSRFVEILKIPNRIIDNLLLWMQKEHLVEVAKVSSDLGRLGYSYNLSEAGEQRARDALDRCSYIGPVPVSIPYYNRGIELQTQRRQKISSHHVREALKGLILPDNFHRSIGPAVNSGTSLFLYGPPGNGKTTIAEAIGKLIAGTDPVWIPYAVTVGGQIIQIHDRLVHNSIPLNGGRTVDIGRVDQRWGLFARPTVMVGGELKMEALDLRFDPVAKFYEAPLQMKANGGMFLIDDFGRQQIRPSDLLNRWIVPLENEIDFLRLNTGQTVVVPFRLFLVFSTNLEPHSLVDDAFLRRIQIKVEVGSPDEKLFYKIFVHMSKVYGIAFERDAFVYLLQRWYLQTGRTLQAVHPRDILRTVLALCEYDGVPPQLTPNLIDEACRIYFVK